MNTGKTEATFTIDRRTLLAGAGAGIAALSAGGAVAQAAPAVRIRRNLSLMTPTDPWFADYADAVAAMHELDEIAPDDRRGWRQQALIHLNHCPHGSIPGFLPWHRHYLRYYEEICGQLIGKPDFALAYFDWSTNRGQIPAAFYANGPLNVAFWLDSSNGSSANWAGGRLVRTIGSRQLPQGRGLLDDPFRGGAFQASAINQIKTTRNYDVFERGVEGSPHNIAHGLIGGGVGHMGDGMSPLDPIFWCHHCNVDRLWAEWQNLGNISTPQELIYDDMFVDANGDSVSTTSLAALNTRTFDSNGDPVGFDYDTLDAIGLFASLIRTESSATRPPPKPSLIGQSDDGEALANRPTNFPVELDELDAAIESSISVPKSIGRSAPAADEFNRLVARFKGVRGVDGGENLIANVFVNCPYLSPETPYVDPHFAGSFAFFMTHGMHPQEFLVDITETVATLATMGRIDPDVLDIQIMPISLKDGSPVDQAKLEVGSVDILRV